MFQSLGGKNGFYLGKIDIKDIFRITVHVITCSSEVS